MGEKGIMSSQFDQLIDRTETSSYKWDGMKANGIPEDAIPLWVADMDFRAPSCVLRSLEDRVDHGVFGYSFTGQSYLDSLDNWFSTRHNWKISPDWLVTTPGVVCAIKTAVRAFTEPEDAVIILQPVYSPFASSVTGCGRKLVVSQLLFEDGKYSVDYEDFERKIADNNVKLFILCSPHNPVGRVWTAEELIHLGEICRRHDVLVVSDEIHQDFVYPGHTHLVFSSLKPEFEEFSIICTAPSKTFNLAALQLSNIFIPNKELREAFQAELSRAGIGEPNLMGAISCEAAYSHGAEWLDELRGYLMENIIFVRRFLADEIPEIQAVEPQGTYLLWLDCRELGLGNEELRNFFLEKAGLWLNNGYEFGAGGEGFMRCNIAAPREVLVTAMNRLKAAINEQPTN